VKVLECVILVGLQGAGKSTLYAQHFADTHELASMDLHPHARKKSVRIETQLRQVLQAGRSVVVDNTNPTIAVRAPLIRIARELGAQVIGYYVEATTREAVARNSKREGRARVPNVGIFTTAKRLQVPTLSEGFDRLYRARMRQDGTFEIVPASD
jgi:predicted kinase